MAKKWEVTITLSRILTYSIEDNETEDDFVNYIKSQIGLQHIQIDFTKHMHLVSYPRNTDLVSIDDVHIIEE